jgi:hypothetical protein
MSSSFPGVSAAVPQDVFSDMLERLQGLSDRLASKEQDVLELRSKNRMLESDLHASRTEAASAHEELQQEATRASLLDQV